jgi:hypothetical protein
LSLALAACIVVDERRPESTRVPVGVAHPFELGHCGVASLIDG